MNFFETALNFIFPPVCIICGKRAQNFICENCNKRINRYEKYKLVDNSNDKILNIDKVYFDKLFYCYNYKKLIRKIILNYKFRGKAYFCNFFAKMLLNYKETYSFFQSYDIIFPVPMEKSKKLIRSYNQTELITNIIVKNTKIYDGKNYIKKIKHTKTQSLLNSEERKENIKNAFVIIDNKIIKGKKIIIFDDIFTTGATVNEISKLLKENGASEILVLVLAKD